MEIKTLNLILLEDFYPPDRFQEKENNSSWRHCPWMSMPYLLTCRSPRTWDNQTQFPCFEKCTDMSGLLEVCNSPACCQMLSFKLSC